MGRVAIVLGAGGITGTAWLLGALEAVHEETGWDPRTADVLCGTSAGAVAAAVLAAGVPTESLLRMAEHPDVLAAESERATGRRPSGRRRVPRAWPGSLLLGLTGLAATDPRHRASSLVGFLPRGIKSNDEIRGLVREAAEPGWPSAPRLLINACDYGTGRRTTFGAADAPSASLADAVTASAAVPGWYEPVTIEDRRYVDGGLASFTNADVVADEDVDVVLCLSPFSSTESGGPADAALFGALRRAMHWRLEREVRGLRAGGKQVVVVEPCREDLQCMGLNVMERSHSRAVVETARTSVRARIGRLLAGVELPAANAPGLRASRAA
jgi:NTE family protein